MLSPIRSLTLALVALALAPALRAQAPAKAQSLVELRRERVDLLRDEIKQTDARLESRLGVIVDTLKKIGDSKDSRTKVARLKEETGKALMKTISYYDQKRSALIEELRNPRLQLTEKDKRKLIAAFTARIEKRSRQIMELNKSMPTHEDHVRYSGSGHARSQRDLNEDYYQNQRMSSHATTQRNAILKQLDAAIARLDRQSRSLKAQMAATPDLARRKALGEDAARVDALIDQRRKQRVEALTPSSTRTRAVGMKEAAGIDEGIQDATEELKRDFNTLFLRYNEFVQELSALRAAEAAAAAKPAR